MLVWAARRAACTGSTSGQYGLGSQPEGLPLARMSTKKAHLHLLAPQEVGKLFLAPQQCGGQGRLFGAAVQRAGLHTPRVLQEAEREGAGR